MRVYIFWIDKKKVGVYTADNITAAKAEAQKEHRTTDVVYLVDYNPKKWKENSKQYLKHFEEFYGTK